MISATLWWLSTVLLLVTVITARVLEWQDRKIDYDAYRSWLFTCLVLYVGAWSHV